jgi:glycine/D-amino acid oxidase-like deaminating enzyme
MRTRHIGIIGAGIAGLHLGLRLQRLGAAQQGPDAGADRYPLPRDATCTRR